MSSKFIVPYGKACPLCGKTVYLEKMVGSGVGTTFSVWCPTRDCPGYSGDYSLTQKQAIRKFKKRVRATGDDEL